MDAQQILILLAVAFGVSLALTPLVMRLAKGVGITDLPSERSVNSRQGIPLMGGLAVGVGFAAGLTVAVRAFAVEIPSGHLPALAGGGALVLVSGIYDDRFGMNAWSKLTVQMVAAALAIYSGFQIDHLTEPFFRASILLPTWMSWMLTTLWIVTITNALNLVDGLDGLAAGIAAIIAATLAVIAGIAGQTFGVCVGVALMGALLGFLPFNFAPARIFLGDTGALFIGYALSLLALESYRQVSLLTFVVPILALAVPILDTLLSVLRRLRSGSPIFNADRLHMHHRMLEWEGSMRSAVLQFYILTAAFCVLALAVSKLEGYSAILFLAAVVLLTYRLVSNLGALSGDASPSREVSVAAGDGKR
jgi:UDP-GlcNAc:undecaprenyl-phosphate GlcNAc-1-phosphate transferase